MAQFYENFQQATVGQLPAGWSAIFTTPSTAVVQEAAGQRYLRVIRAGLARYRWLGTNYSWRQHLVGF